jgi:hypothetical protein
MKKIEEINLTELKKEIDSFWNLPNVEKGKDQIPYLYGEEDNKLLNRLMNQFLKLNSQ